MGDQLADFNLGLCLHENMDEVSKLWLVPATGENYVANKGFYKHMSTTLSTQVVITSRDGSLALPT